MAMFDDVDKKLSGWFNAGAEKAKGMSETLRLSNAIREEETKQAELYRQMGKYFYDYFAVAAEGKMKEWCDGVKASQQQVQVYKEQIQTLKGTVSCPNCGPRFLLVLHSAMCVERKQNTKCPKPVRDEFARYVVLLFRKVQRFVLPVELKFRQ